MNRHFPDLWSCENRWRKQLPNWPQSLTAQFNAKEVLRVHSSLPEYRPTPLVKLTELAETLGIGKVLVKDESHRFGLKAFKALGASYALFCLLTERFGLSAEQAGKCRFSDLARLAAQTDMTLCTATDGNHGRGVAWCAAKLSLPAIIYMPENSVAARIEAIRADGAEVRVIEGTYDDAVTQCTRDAEKFGWQVVSDTAWSGYEEIPRRIMAGYLTIFTEIKQDISDPPNIVFIPGGVGALAAAASWFYNTVFPGVRLVCVEPISAACLLESAAMPNGQPIRASGRLDSIMAGLNCGTPSTAAWPFIRDGFDLFLAVSDDKCREAMRLYCHSRGQDQRIEAGESGAATMAGLLQLCNDNRLAEERKTLGLNSNSTVLLLNTEGATDPVNYQEIVYAEP